MSANGESDGKETRRQTEYTRTTSTGIASRKQRSELLRNQPKQNSEYPKDPRRTSPLAAESIPLPPQKGHGEEKKATVERSTIPAREPETSQQLWHSSWSQPRLSTFRLCPNRICDEKVIRHDHSVASHYESDSSSGGPIPSSKKSGLRGLGFGRGRRSSTNTRHAVHHRNLAGLSLIANLTRVQYGSWHESSACLIGFKFQFLKAGSSRARFEKAGIAIRFSTFLMLSNIEMGQESNAVLVGVAEDPEVVDFGPKHVASSGNEEEREWHVSAQLSASLPAAPVSLSPGIQSGLSRSYDKHYASSVDATSLPSHGHTTCDTVRFWIREDPKQKNGLPMELDCAIVVTYDAPASFQAVVDVNAGPVFDMLAQPWGDEEPIVFQHGEEMGEPVRGNPVGGVDFANLTAQDWAELVGAESLVTAGRVSEPRYTPAMAKLSGLLCK